MDQLWPHLVRGGIQVLTIALGTYLGVVLYMELSGAHDEQNPFAHTDTSQETLHLYAS
jgi:hypothetical protein